MKLLSLCYIVHAALLLTLKIGPTNSFDFQYSSWCRRRQGRLNVLWQLQGHQQYSLVANHNHNNYRNIYRRFKEVPHGRPTRHSLHQIMRYEGSIAEVEESQSIAGRVRLKQDTEVEHRTPQHVGVTASPAHPGYQANNDENAHAVPAADANLFISTNTKHRKISSFRPSKWTRHAFSPLRKLRIKSYHPSDESDPSDHAKTVRSWNF
jgi:hypothetical protein